MAIVRNMLQEVRDRLARRKGAAVRQAGAIPYTILEGQAVFLLITSRRTGRWIFPKGELNETMTPWELAAHEAFEEAGVRGAVERAPVGSYRAIKTLALRRYPIVVDLYPLRVEEQLGEWPEKGQRHRHWAVLHEAKRLLSDKGAAEIVARFAAKAA